MKKLHIREITDRLGKYYVLVNEDNTVEVIEFTFETVDHTD